MTTRCKSDMLSRFGLRTTPFTREVPAHQHFEIPEHDTVLEELSATVAARMAGVLIAPSGSGKTALVRRLRARLPEARYRVHYVDHPNLSRRDLCREIAATLGIASAGSFPALLRGVRERFRGSLDDEKLQPILILDDVHEVRPEVLGLLKALTNFDMDGRLVLGLLLVGQSPLRELLARAELADVAGRVAHLGELRLLSSAEVHRYLEHRMTIAGARTFPFDSEAVEAIVQMTRGNMRAIDHLARKTLCVAHEADTDVPGANHVAAARRRLPS